MSADVNTGAVELKGFDELAAKLRGIVPALRKRVLRNALAAGARLVRDEAKRIVPVLKPENRNPYRKVGTVKKALSVRTSKIARKAGDVGVFVNVRPLKKSAISAFKASRAKAGQSFSGSKNPDDPYYWQWLEFGRQARAGSGAVARVKRIKVMRDGKRVILREGVRARRGRRAVGSAKAFEFLQGGAKKLPQALRIFEDAVAKWFAKTNASGKVQP